MKTEHDRGHDLIRLYWAKGETMTEDGFYIRVPFTPGRVHDNGDHLGTGERAVVDWLSELPGDRLRAVVAELLSIEKFRIELWEMRLDDEERGLDGEGGV